MLTKELSFGLDFDVSHDILSPLQNEIFSSIFPKIFRFVYIYWLGIRKASQASIEMISFQILLPATNTIYASFWKWLKMIKTLFFQRIFANLNLHNRILAKVARKILNRFVCQQENWELSKTAKIEKVKIGVKVKQISESFKSRNEKIF